MEAVHQWSIGEHYEAHEIFEEFAEEVEDDDDDWERALALCHVAASVHKYLHNVSPAAVPGKLERALPVLESSPPDWFNLDMVTFRKQVRNMLESLQKGEQVEVPTLRFVSSPT
ncbi:MAG: hypothetical protein VYC39_19220 [Myxococcota bacterium]|nr:hypothetical protein [Myxococcota bacterium]